MNGSPSDSIARSHPYIFADFGSATVFYDTHLCNILTLGNYFEN